ncbi:hypothetical protein FACS18945_1380 [Bacteroidia bacterium]|nr:hypothetical protein FACS18945_1380 [Bacteroidia bacterium]
METLTKKRTVAGNVSRRQNMTTITLSYNAQNALLNSIIQTALLAGAKQVQAAYNNRIMRAKEKTNAALSALLHFAAENRKIETDYTFNREGCYDR